MKVAVFTPFSPALGGGSVIVRRLIENMPGIEFQWFHLNDRACTWPGSTYLGEAFTGGFLPRDLWRSTGMWAGLFRNKYRGWARSILASSADLHWVIAMNESFPLALELMRTAPQIPLHLSVHDDQNCGLYLRSRRYVMLPLISRFMVRHVLRKATSIDVVSDGMGAFYRKSLSLRPEVARHLIPSLPVVPPFAPSDVFRIGHIGTVYSIPQMVEFLNSVREMAILNGKSLQLLLIGASPALTKKLQDLTGLELQSPGNLPESEAVLLLSQCDLLYAMYPFDRASEIFRRTSLPTKLTTYIQAQRPVFAHTPIKSSLARAVRRFGIGVICASRQPALVTHALHRLLQQSITKDAFIRAQSEWYGKSNVARIRACLEVASNPTLETHFIRGASPLP